MQLPGRISKCALTGVAVAVFAATSMGVSPGALAAEPGGAAGDSMSTVQQSSSRPYRTLTPTETRSVIREAQKSDSAGFAERRATLAKSGAFMDVLTGTTPNPAEALDFFAAVSTQAQADAVVAHTEGKRFVISGTEENPSVQLAAASSGESIMPNSTPMPRCAEAWAAFAAFLAAQTMLCVPFSGPAAWACAVAMGLLGLMPNFNDACD